MHTPNPISLVEPSCNCICILYISYIYLFKLKTLAAGTISSSISILFDCILVIYTQQSAFHKKSPITNLQTGVITCSFGTREVMLQPTSVWLPHTNVELFTVVRVRIKPLRRTHSSRGHHCSSSVLWCCVGNRGSNKLGSSCCSWIFGWFGHCLICWRQIGCLGSLAI